MKKTLAVLSVLVLVAVWLGSHRPVTPASVAKSAQTEEQTQTQNATPAGDYADLELKPKVELKK